MARNKTAVVVVGIVLSLVLSLAANALASERLLCKQIDDTFKNKCDVMVDAVTRVVNNQQKKGHILICQGNWYSCLDGVCKNNFKSDAYAFSFGMSEYGQFCKLLCNNPSCPSDWVK